MLELSVPSNAKSAQLQAVKLKLSDKTLALLLFAIALLSLLPTLGITRIIDPSDGFFAESARELLESNNFIVPTLNYAPYNDKPILTHWLIAASYAVLGVSEFASRLPSALCASALCVATFAFARRYANSRTAWFAGLILVSSYLFSILARVSLTDMPLALFLNLSLFSFFIGWKEQSKKFQLLGWIALGIALLTKGPIAFLITLGAFLIYFLASEKQFQPAETFKKLVLFRSVPGLLIAAAIAVPWYVAVGIATHGAYLKDFFIVQNFQRAAGTIANNHAQPFWFYIPIIAITTFPWSAFFAFMIPLLKKWWAKRTVQTKRYQLLLFCASICITVFSGFSVLKGKLPTYMLPLYPAAAILVAAAFNTALRLKKPKFLLNGGLLAMIVSLAAIPKLFDALHADTVAKTTSIYLIFGAYATVLGIFAFSIWRQKFVKEATHFLILSCAVLSAVLVPFLFVQFYEYHQRDYAALLDLAISRNPESISEIWCSNPSASFYAKKRVANIQSFYDYGAVMAFPGEHLVLYQESFQKFVSKAPIHKLIAQRGEWRLESVADPTQTLLNEHFCIQSNANKCQLK